MTTVPNRRRLPGAMNSDLDYIERRHAERARRQAEEETTPPFTPAPVEAAARHARGDEEPATFALTVNLGNAGMLTEQDVAAALRLVAERLEDGHRDGPARDENGNAVGSWEMSA